MQAEDTRRRKAGGTERKFHLIDAKVSVELCLRWERPMLGFAVMVVVWQLPFYKKPAWAVCFLTVDLSLNGYVYIFTG